MHAAVGVDAATWPEVGVTSVEPHSPQNFIVGAFPVPHAGQARASALPHSPQNFRPSSFSALHVGQTIVVTPPVSHAGGPRETEAR
jgi:hypothetical protein